MNVHFVAVSFSSLIVVSMVKHHQSTRKTIRFTEKQEDYISLLPDCLLIDVISRLPTTKEAIRTGTLSKRWQHLWPFVSNLIFFDHNYDCDEFISLVDKTLTKCHQSNLHKFQIDTCYSVQFESPFNSWIRYAVTRNVQDLELSIPYFELDQFMFINSCFTHLNLDGCLFNPTGAISWSKLRSLSITRVNDFSEDLLQNILSGSPLLETLMLKECYGFRRLDITSKSLKDCVLNLSDLVVDEFMFTNSCFTRLKLHNCVFNPVSAISWSNLKSLSIFWLNDLTEDLIQKILSGSPLLETLKLKECYGFRRIDIMSKSVQNFVFSGYKDSNHNEDFNDIIEINAPYIVSLKFANGLRLEKLLLVDVSCLVKAHLDYDKCGIYEPTGDLFDEDMLKGLILSLRHVKELKIGNSCLEVLSRLEAKDFIFPSNLKVVDVASPLPNDTHSDLIETADTSHSDSNESGDSEGIVEQVFGTCCAHNCGRGRKLTGVASTTCAHSQESMYTQNQVDAMFEIQNKMIATQHRMIEAQSLQFSTLVRALIKSGFPVPDSIVPGSVNEGNEEKDGEEENDK